MRYWWVNQNQTYRHEVGGGYLWSPKRKKNNQRNVFYEFMREVAPGDVVLSFMDTRIAALGVAQTAQVLELVRRLADNGLGVVLISHNMNDVFAVSDRIAALYLGRMAAQVKATDVTHSQVVELITAGRSGNVGLPPEKPADFVDITPPGDDR